MLQILPFLLLLLQPLLLPLQVLVHVIKGGLVEVAVVALCTNKTCSWAKQEHSC